MAWHCSGSSNSALIGNLVLSSILHSPPLRSAFLLVDRADFCPRAPYEDAPQSIGHGATISAPHMHAHALEELLPAIGGGGKVLDVGSGR